MLSPLLWIVLSAAELLQVHVWGRYTATGDGHGTVSESLVDSLALWSEDQIGKRCF